MRSRAPLLALLLAIGVALPAAAHAGGVPFFGPIIPTGDYCPLGFGELIVVVNNIISFLLTLGIVFFTPLIVAYAGFIFVVSGENAGERGRAKGIIWNVVKGIVIALLAWSIVDAIMAVLYNPTAVGSTWYSLVSGGNDVCIVQAGATQGEGLNQAQQGGSVTTTTTKADARTTTQLTTPGGACNPQTVTDAALASAPYNAPAATQTQAKQLACIAQGESTCGTLNPPYNLNYSWGKLFAGKASTAAGAYQVLLSSNHACYEYAACYKAAGLPADGSTKLDCQNAFQSNGMPIAGAALDRCKQAAGNIQCSATAAVCLLNKQSFASAYGTDPYVASCQAAAGG